MRNWSIQYPPPSQPPTNPFPSPITSLSPSISSHNQQNHASIFISTENLPCHRNRNANANANQAHSSLKNSGIHSTLFWLFILLAQLSLLSLVAAITVMIQELKVPQREVSTGLLVWGGLSMVCWGVGAGGAVWMWNRRWARRRGVGLEEGLEGEQIKLGEWGGEESLAGSKGMGVSVGVEEGSKGWKGWMGRRVREGRGGFISFEGGEGRHRGDECDLGTYRLGELSDGGSADYHDRHSGARIRPKGPEEESIKFTIPKRRPTDPSVSHGVAVPNRSVKDLRQTQWYRDLRRNNEDRKSNQERLEKSSQRYSGRV